MLDTLRSAAASNAKHLATGRHGQLEALEDSTDQLRREFVAQAAQFAPVVPALERQLAEAIRAAGPAIARRDIEQEAARTAHAELAPQVEGTIGDLLNWDDPGGARLGKRLAANRADAHADYVTALAPDAAERPEAAAAAAREIENLMRALVRYAPAAEDGTAHTEMREYAAALTAMCESRRTEYRALQG